MFTVYILRSSKNNKRYIDLTSDLKRRLAEHDRGKSRFTSQNRPWQLVYSEKFDDKDIAAKREKFFKTGVGRKFLKDIGF